MIPVILEKLLYVIDLLEAHFRQPHCRIMFYTWRIEQGTLIVETLKKVTVGATPVPLKAVPVWSDGAERPTIDQPTWAFEPEGVLSIVSQSDDWTQISVQRVGPGVASIFVTIGSVVSEPCVVAEPPAPIVTSVLIVPVDPTPTV